MVVIRVLRAHLDAVVAVLLAATYLAEAAISARLVSGEAVVTDLRVDEAVVLVAGTTFLLSLSLRARLPLLPLGLAFVALALAGRVPFTASWSLLAGVILAVYSVGAWAGGRAGQVGALGVGAFAGLAVLRTPGPGLEAREVAVPVFVLIGAWLLGLAMRNLRVGRGDERVAGPADWEVAAGVPDSVGRDDTVRELRDVVERSMSAVVLQSRSARRALDGEPAQARRALAIIEAAGTEALEETQRLTGLLLSPDGTPLPEPRPGLADLEYLAVQITEAGLAVALRVEGQPLPLTPDLDAAAFQVVHEALLSTLHHSAAGRSDVVVRYLPDELQVEITDDGVGIEDADMSQETAGLLAVRDEVAALGGTLDAGPGKGRGYWVLGRFPYEPDWR
ncbi:MAG TPA: histidine kinase [Candidatus Deferrimicrobium sp.]|nr:histidine kinase [Candidatus Deferrimicrobium sp.]